MAENFTFQSGGALLAADAAGTGQPMVFLHAGVADRRMFAPQLKAFGARYQAIAYDRRGFGDTRTPDEAFSQVEDLDALFQARKLNGAILVGCSQGGRIALDFTLVRPDRVKALVLVGTAVSGAPTPRDLSDQVVTLLGHLEDAEEDEDIDAMNAVEAHMWLDGPHSQEGRVGDPLRKFFLEVNNKILQAPPMNYEVAPKPAFERIDELDVPVLLVSGGLDFPHILDRQTALAKMTIGAKSHVIPDTAHLPSLEQPEIFNRLVTEFLDTIED